MDRCALFVDAGYVLADGAQAVHGTRRRESVSWDYPGLLQLLASLAMERSRLPLLRCYWYDSTVEGRRSSDHDALADLPGVKLRLAKMRPGRREGVEGEIHRDLTTLARNKAVSDAMVVSAEEDLAQVIADVQDLGMRVTLLHIATEGNAEIPRALRQECDDIVQISASQLRPFAELISGAEPPRRDERDGAMLALHAGANGNGSNGHGHGHGNGHGNGRALLGRVAQHAAAERPEEDRAEPVREPAAAHDTVADYSTVADYGTVADYRPLEDYRGGQDYNGPSLPDYGAPGPSVPDFTPAPPAAAGRPEFTARAEAAARQDGQFRSELPELPPREELYAAPVAVPQLAVPQAADDLTAERGPGRPRPEPDVLRPVESGYNPGGLRDQFQLEAAREPLTADPGDRYPVPVAVPAAAPVGPGAIRRLPVHNGAQVGQSGGQPSLAQPSFGEPLGGQQSGGQPSFGQPPQAQGPTGPVHPGFGAGPSGPSGPASDHGSGGQPIAPVLPMEQPGQGYGGNRGAAYGGPRPVNGPVSPVSPVSLVGQPSGPAAQAGQPGPGDGGQGQQARPGQPGQAGQPGPDAYPALSQVAPPPPPAQQDVGGSPGYSGGQSGVSLSDAVQSAHEEGQTFGESVARDAPALWLEAVLARKPRMPSDLEARLLQGSALPIDFLLHDEVRHALRRGFWDALEHARR
ncbi:MAG TPA: NYN domain-containing protein [Trebonia sp.]|nr:NYN domain-containing protein [Trebonia sp.]